MSALRWKRHYLFRLNDGNNGTQVGLGPLVAVQMGSDDKIVDAIGLGVMMGFRRTKDDDDPDNNNRDGSWGNRFNIGLGVMFDPNVQKLGDGLVRNEPLPAGDSLRYREEHAYRGVIVVTYSP